MCVMMNRDDSQRPSYKWIMCVLMNRDDSQRPSYKWILCVLMNREDLRSIRHVYDPGSATPHSADCIPRGRSSSSQFINLIASLTWTLARSSSQFIKCIASLIWTSTF